MPDIYGSHFEYAGVSSAQYGLIIANVETDRFVQVSGSIEGNTVFNRVSKKRYLIDDDYSDFPVSYEIEVVSDDNRCLTSTERRTIEKWLFNKHNYRKLYLDITNDLCAVDTIEMIGGVVKRLYMNCRFVNPERLEYNGGIVGYRATLEADSGLWWQDAVTQTFAVNNASASATSNITVVVDTDIDDYTYPKVTITMGSVGGDIIISNNTDSSSRLTKFKSLAANTTVVLKGEINYASIGGQTSGVYTKFSARNFPRLKDGNNVFTINGNVASISFEFNNRRAL